MTKVEFKVGDKVRIKEESWNNGSFSRSQHKFDEVFEVLATRMTFGSQALHLKGFERPWIFAHYFVSADMVSDDFTLCEIEA